MATYSLTDLYLPKLKNALFVEENRSRSRHNDTQWFFVGTLYFGWPNRPSSGTYLLLQSLTDFLVLVPCNIHTSSHPLNKEQEQITLLEGENTDFIFWMEKAWGPLCCHANVTVQISWNFVVSETTVQSFSSIQKKYSDDERACYWLTLETRMWWQGLKTKGAGYCFELEFIYQITSWDL